jgi:cytochrome c553
MLGLRRASSSYRSLAPLPTHGRGVLILVLAVCFIAPARAGDMAAGREKAKVCAPCHGMDGLSKAMNAANIAGQLELYLIEQLKAYRKGERKNEQMSIVTEGLSDGDIADLAAYYSAIEIKVKVPQ